MKHLFFPLLIFTICFNSYAQLETISLKSSSKWTTRGVIKKIGKDYITFKPVSLENDNTSNENIKFKNSENGLTTPYKSKKGNDGFHQLKTSDINLITSSNNFKRYLLNSGSSFNILEDRIGYNEMKLSKFRQLQLTARWISILGAVVTTVSAISNANNPTSDSNSEFFMYGGAALSGLGFIIDLASFSNLKFEKSYKSYDEKTKTYTFE